jgi:hypothetical protein
LITMLKNLDGMMVIQMISLSDVVVVVHDDYRLHRLNQYHLLNRHYLKIYFDLALMLNVLDYSNDD